MSTNLLEKFSEHLPAIRDTEPEPVEPSESREILEQGRRPEDVVQPRDEFDRTVREPEPQSERTVTVRGQELAAKDVEQLAQAYEAKAAEVAAQQQQQAAPRQITNGDIAKTYDPVSVEILNDLLARGLLEEDLTATYPRAMQTFTGQARFAFDLIGRNQQALERAIERLEATITYLNHHKAKLEATGGYDALLDTLSKREPRLKDAKARADFSKFIVDKMNEAAQESLNQLWVEFSGSATGTSKQLSTSQKEDARWRAQQGKGRVTGDIPGIVGAGGDLLLRLAASSGKMVR